MNLVSTDRSTSKPPLLPDAIPPTSVLGRLASLKTETMVELKDQWRSLFSAEPPLYNRANLEARIAYRIQELAYGGIRPPIVKRLEAIGEQLDGGNITLRRIRGDDKPIAGTRHRTHRRRAG